MTHSDEQTAIQKCSSAPIRKANLPSTEVIRVVYRPTTGRDCCRLIHVFEFLSRHLLKVAELRLEAALDATGGDIPACRARIRAQVTAQGCSDYETAELRSVT